MHLRHAIVCVVNTIDVKSGLPEVVIRYGARYGTVVVAHVDHEALVVNQAFIPGFSSVHHLISCTS